MGQVTNRGVDADPATQQDLETYQQAQAQLDRMRIPVLLRADNPHERLYIAALDGTGNSMVNDNPENWSALTVFDARAYKDSRPPAKDAARMRLPPTRTTTAAYRLLVALLSVFLLAGCQPVMSTTAMSGNAPVPSGDGTYSTTTADWPLKFRGHKFGAHCFDTQRCEILYRGFPHGEKDKPAPSVASYGRPLEKLLTAGRGPITNFPPPAKVTWRSHDDTPLEAQVDIGEIFKDQLIRHNVPREDLTENQGSLPEIILEVNDRTINVYMRVHLSTKKLQEPGNRYSGFRNDLIKVYSRTY